MSELQFSLVEGDALDYAVYVNLQREAYAELLRAQQVSDSYMSEAYYRWKYDTPPSRARIALAHSGSHLVAANAMYPLCLRLGDSRVQAWQSCDTATAPAARGKGCFQGCLRVLEESLEPNSVFFGFPNRNSIRGFVKLGWEEKTTVRTYVNPFTFLRKKQSPFISEIEAFDETQELFGDKLAHRDIVCVERSAAYLNWRYTRHPIHDYAMHAFTEDGETRGYLVVRVAQAMGRRLLVVMESLGLTRSIEALLLRHAAGKAWEVGCTQMVLLDSALPLPTALAAGCVPVPERFLPKRQVLMGYATAGGGSARAFMAARWRVQLGDWDAF